MSAPTPAPPVPELTCHASCLVFGEDGILIRGPSGAGKSSLCLELLDRADLAGEYAALVGDDRIGLRATHGRVVARPHPAIAGMIEIRGLGIRRVVRPAPATVIRLVVDLVEETPRLPEADSEAESTMILGVRLPRLVLEPRHPRAYVIRQALSAVRQERIVSPRSHSAAALVAVPSDV